MGIDVYHGTGPVNWSRVATAGNMLGVCKATQGVSEIDADLAHNLSGMKTAGMVRGVYHFVDLTKSGVQQALHCINAVRQGGYEWTTDLPLFLDLEPDPSNPGAADAVGRAGVRKIVDDWTATVKTYTGRMTGIYVSLDFCNQYVGDGYGGHPLWLAHYSSEIGALPDGWTDWRIWQYSERGTVPGIGGAVVDMDKFNGTVEQLRKWAAGG